MNISLCKTLNNSVNVNDMNLKLDSLGLSPISLHFFTEESIFRPVFELMWTIRKMWSWISSEKVKVYITFVTSMKLSFGEPFAICVFLKRIRWWYILRVCLKMCHSCSPPGSFSGNSITLPL